MFDATRTTTFAALEARGEGRVRAVRRAVRRGGFGALHQYELKRTRVAKRGELPHERRIPDVCNPQRGHFDGRQ